VRLLCRIDPPQSLLSTQDNTNTHKHTSMQSHPTAVRSNPRAQYLGGRQLGSVQSAITRSVIVIIPLKFQWPNGLRHRCAAARLLRLWVPIPVGGMDVCCECCVLSDRGLWDGQITRPEKSYRLFFVVVCDLETSWMRKPWPIGGCCTKNITINVIHTCALRKNSHNKTNISTNANIILLPHIIS